MRRRSVAAAALTGGLAYSLIATGRATIDTGLGRRLRPLGPLTVAMAAPRATVYEVIATPYLGRAPRAVADHIRVVERGRDMVVAAHRTPIGWGMVTTTVEAVRFEPPEVVAFRLLRGPVPHVVERFTLQDDAGSTRLTYQGELGTDLWSLGGLWADVVARKWVATVRASLDTVRREAERRAGMGDRKRAGSGG